MKRCVPVKEKAFQRTVVEYARLMGWRIHHTRPALAQSGRWHTPLQGDRGLPDLILCRPPRLLFVELKANRQRKPTLEQRAWLADLRACGVEVYLWTPEDWHAVRQVLARSRDCPDCVADGETPKGLCVECGGTGRLDESPCEECSGSGLCATCSGTGELESW